MRNQLNNKRFHDLLNLEILKISQKEDKLVIVYPLNTKLPMSFIIDGYLDYIEIINNDLIIHLVDNLSLKYKISKTKYDRIWKMLKF